MGHLWAPDAARVRIDAGSFDADHHDNRDARAPPAPRPWRPSDFGANSGYAFDDDSDDDSTAAARTARTADSDAAAAPSDHALARPRRNRPAATAAARTAATAAARTARRADRDAAATPSDHALERPRRNRPAATETIAADPETADGGHA